MRPRSDQELHRPIAWAIAILVILAIGIVVVAPRPLAADDSPGPDRGHPPPACQRRDCERLAPHLDLGIELYVRRM